MSERTDHDRRQRRLLIGVALMFFAPLAFAFYLYYGHAAWHPGGNVAAGTLVVPARPLPNVSLPRLLAQNVTGPDTGVAAGFTDPRFLQGKWTFLYVQRGACDAGCSKHLYDTRQVRIALDREMNRVQRVFIASPDCCDLKSLHEAHPDLILLSLGAAAQPLLEQLPTTGGSTFLIDPLGNLMMSYAPDAKPKGMLEDMKRLLRLSQIG